MRLLCLLALSLASCDSNPPPPSRASAPLAQDACALAIGDWTIVTCQHLIVDGGQPFETPGGAVLTVAMKGEELTVGAGDEPAKTIPNERSATRCAGPGLTLTLTSATTLQIDRSDVEFKSRCALTR